MEDDQWMDLVTPSVCPSTMKKLRFVLSLFNEWREKRNARCEMQIPRKDLVDFSVEELNR